MRTVSRWKRIKLILDFTPVCILKKELEVIRNERTKNKRTEY
ncbi:hypothetical protein DFR58_10672 [Anaerobacterium chartisolvens]|uniref:Uncharacterized protein n=1 Tax=Anaerobacterium chartisolvens TaxID=1297424 RepID=A0A369BE07_9FIRM|nr:hypothetical protein DFR58_10672 [Anaerobacterium chartisolvens]